MKRIIIAALAAILAVSTAACSQPQTAATPDSAATVDSATPDERAAVRATAGTAAPTAAGTTQSGSTQPTTKKQETTKPTVKATQPTSAPAQGNIPADTVTSAHVNPYLSYIQGNVAAEIEALAVTGITLERGSVTIGEGGSASIHVSIEPENAAIKKCAVNVSNDCVTAEMSGGMLHIHAKKAGESTVSLTTHNGLTVSCVVYVTAKPTDAAPTKEETKAQETTDAPSTEQTEAPAAEPAE